MDGLEVSPFDGPLLALFEKRGAPLVSVPILQPADPYLDTAGEALRRRIFLTRGEGGENLCLRPDFTIPVCLSHLAERQALPRRYSYRGLIFRQQRSGPAEFIQAGVEDLGEPDLASADARAVADSLAALEACGVGAGMQTILGDQGLFEAFLAALGLPDGWQRRLIRTFGENALLGKAMGALARGAKPFTLDPALRDLAKAGEAGELTREIRVRMSEAGLPIHTGRSPGEIAARLIEKVAVAETRLDEGALEALRAFLSIDCSLDQARERLTSVAGRRGLDLGPALAFFEARNHALDAAMVDLSAIRYRAAFGRPLDYYTGLVFEVREPGSAEPLVGGGRYDRLLDYLGASEAVPAVGFSLWLDRVATLTGKDGR
ncbi:ATP phosphoribosyltransferase regulatory subunit [Consotaella salsifontis]|uniref:ATP phosphoribosyltransferase regulatory subunit n=1 Tax=Consotaella salsifontis TaxID=1365950 RepID=A0A1T4Q016_9HYPH|nr:ATP phosphoribosyltransferase regulatory subunit [Consotaella salsifontis]SJZ96887.1 ATP phosphoribosyltransferase regulatory subunit [Consotaella salsifontis]